MDDMEDTVGMYQSGKVLVVPIQTEIYDETVAQLKDQITRRVHSKQIHGVLIDVSSVNIIDRHLIEEFTAISKMVNLLGATMVLVGIKANIAITLAELNADMSDLITALTVERGFALLEKIQSEKVSNFTEENDDNSEDEEGSLDDETMKNEDELDDELSEKNTETQHGEF